MITTFKTPKSSEVESPTIKPLSIQSFALAYTAFGSLTFGFWSSNGTRNQNQLLVWRQVFHALHVELGRHSSCCDLHISFLCHPSRTNTYRRFGSIGLACCGRRLGIFSAFYQSFRGYWKHGFTMLTTNMLRHTLRNPFKKIQTRYSGLKIIWRIDSVTKLTRKMERNNTMRSIDPMALCRDIHLCCTMLCSWDSRRCCAMATIFLLTSLFSLRLQIHLLSYNSNSIETGISSSKV